MSFFKARLVRFEEIPKTYLNKIYKRSKEDRESIVKQRDYNIDESRRIIEEEVEEPMRVNTRGQRSSRQQTSVPGSRQGGNKPSVRDSFAEMLIGSRPPRMWAQPMLCGHLWKVPTAKKCIN